MSLRFFADHCVPRSVTRVLRDAGHEVFILQEQMPHDSDDTLVIAKAQEMDAILVSFDSDFTDIVTYPPSHYQGIIAMQVRDHPEVIPALMRRLVAYLSVYSDRSHYKGRLFLVEVHRIRMRQ